MPSAQARKWSGCRIYDAAEGFRGEIIGLNDGFEWNDGEDPQNVAVVRGSAGQREFYCVLDLPALIKAAQDEQPDYIVLAFE